MWVLAIAWVLAGATLGSILFWGDDDFGAALGAIAALGVIQIFRQGR